MGNIVVNHQFSLSMRFSLSSHVNFSMEMHKMVRHVTDKDTVTYQIVEVMSKFNLPSDLTKYSGIKMWLFFLQKCRVVMWSLVCVQFFLWLDSTQNRYDFKWEIFWNLGWQFFVQFWIHYLGYICICKIYHSRVIPHPPHGYSEIDVTPWMLKHY